MSSVSCAHNQRESADCRAVHAEYDAAYLEHSQASAVIRGLLEGRAAAGVIIGAGAAAALVPGIGWGIGAVIAGFGVFMGALNHVSLTNARRRCQAALARMQAAALDSGRVCESEACWIDRPTEECP